MPRLPPKLRRKFWRWHDQLIDFSDTTKGRLTILSVSMAASMGCLLAYNLYIGNDGLLRLLTAPFR